MSSRNVLAVLACLAFLQGGLAQLHRPATRARDGLLKQFLQDYLPAPVDKDDRSTRYASAFVRLNGGASEDVIVYLTGSGWCGSGGCTMLMLAPKSASFRVVTRTTITRLPIRVLASKSHGWRDIAVVVQGGGIYKKYEAKLSFDGETYPSNPSRPPARRMYKKEPGDVIVPLDSEGTLLYP